MADTLTKQPNESRLFDMDFSSKMRTGETITGISSVVSDPAGLVFDSQTFSGQLVQLLVSGGDEPISPELDKKEYKITVLVVTSSSQVLEYDGILEIEDE